MSNALLVYDHSDEEKENREGIIDMLVGTHKYGEINSGLSLPDYFKQIHAVRGDCGLVILTPELSVSDEDIDRIWKLKLLKRNSMYTKYLVDLELRKAPAMSLLGEISRETPVILCTNLPLDSKVGGAVREDLYNRIIRNDVTSRGKPESLKQLEDAIKKIGR